MYLSSDYGILKREPYSGRWKDTRNLFVVLGSTLIVLSAAPTTGNYTLIDLLID